MKDLTSVCYVHTVIISAKYIYPLMQYFFPCIVYLCMDTTLAYNALMAEQDKRIAKTVRESRRSSMKVNAVQPR